MLMSRGMLELAKVAPKDEARFSILGIRVKPGMAEVTDGRKMIRFTQTEPIPDKEFPVNDAINGVHEVPPGGITIPADAALAAAKAVPKRSPAPILLNVLVGTNGDGSAVLASTDLATWSVQRVKPLEGMWPATEKVIPDARKVKSTTVLAIENIKAICDRAAAMGVEHLRIDIIDDCSAVAITGKVTEGCPGDFLAVVMPMQGKIVALRPGHRLTPKPEEEMQDG